MRLASLETGVTKREETFFLSALCNTKCLAQRTSDAPKFTFHKTYNCKIYQYLPNEHCPRKTSLAIIVRVTAHYQAEYPLRVSTKSND